MVDDATEVEPVENQAEVCMRSRHHTVPLSG